MIKPDRLKELIKEKATIYGITGLPRWVEEIDLGSLLYEEIGNWLYRVDIFFYGSGEYDFRKELLYRFGNEDLFETKEDAEFALRYKRIPKTEYLDLPTWEEFIKGKSVCFKTKNIEYRLYIYTINAKTNNCRIMISADEYNCNWFVFEKPATKENYIDACRLAKKLFLGSYE